MQEKIRIRQATKCGYIEMKNGGVADLSWPKSTLRRGRVQGDGEIAPTIICNCDAIHRVTRYKNMQDEYEYRIRKLTPKECWRLMDFNDADYLAAEKVNSNSQLYKQAGNSIVCNVLVAIMGQMIPDKENIYKERSDAR